MLTYTPTNQANLLRAILWQYENAGNLKALLQYQQDFYDSEIRGFWDDFYTDIVNLDTANTFGLRLWGFIAGVERPSYLVGMTLTPFSDDTYRRMIKARLLLQKMRGDMHNINDYLQVLFPDKHIETVDNQNMTITYNAFFTPTAEEEALLVAIDGILPRPAGVLSILNIISFPLSEYFGFSGQRLNNFDNSVFHPET